MPERSFRNVFGWLIKKSTTNDEKPDPRSLYESNLLRDLSQIENLPVPAPTLHKHLINNRSPHHYGARCLTIINTGKQIQEGDTTIIKMPEKWQHLVGGENIRLSKNGISFIKEAMHKFEEDYAMSLLNNSK